MVAIMGPSGCGKSTLLRLIAGLESITSGNILIDQQPVADLPPRERNIAVVFQDYALYPHKSVFENMAFGLKLRKEPKEKMQEEIIQFFAAVTMDLRRTNEIQRQKINQQEKRIRQLEKRANEFVMFRDKAKHPFRTIWKKLFR